MTTQEVIGPLILHGLFAALGSFATVGALAIKNLTVNDADLPSSKFNRAPSEESRKRFLLMFSLAPFICGGIWGLVYSGALSGSINEAVSYAAAMAVGIIANNVVLKLNNMSLQALVKTVKDNLSV